MSPSTLTAHLLKSSPDSYSRATKHAFLKLAGTGALPQLTLQSWINQDRLYTQAYIRFASLLLSSIDLPVAMSNNTSLNERLADWLVGAIANVWRESKLFEDIGVRWGWDRDAELTGDKDETGKGKGVRGYEKIFGEVGNAVKNGEMGVWEGMVLLWGTEKCYLEAWTYAASCTTQAQKDPSTDADGGVTRKELIPNWNSPDFAKFVDEVEKLLNECFEKEGHGNLKRAEELWDQILDVEQIFWPDV